MSVSGISSGSMLGSSVQTWQARAQKIQSEFQELGQDLQAGNLTQAQSDFSILNQNLSGSGQNNGLASQAFAALGSALQTGGVAAAQQAYSTLQQGFEKAGFGHHHPHHAEPGSTSASSTGSGGLSQLFSSLASALQSGNLSAAQTAYSTLSQDLQVLGLNSSANTTSLAGALSLIG